MCDVAWRWPCGTAFGGGRRGGGSDAGWGCVVWGAVRLLADGTSTTTLTPLSSTTSSNAPISVA